MQVFAAELDVIQYRHKKFDQAKKQRCRYDSNSSGNSSCQSSDIDSQDDLRNTKATNSPFRPDSINSADTQFDFLPIQRKASGKTKKIIDPTIVRRPRRSSVQAAAVLSKLSQDTINQICKYHSNMARHFPAKQRSIEDQERRDKNTIACRKSRRLKKLEHLALVEECQDFAQQTFDLMEQTVRSAIYLNQLRLLSRQLCDKVVNASSPNHSQSSPHQSQEAIRTKRKVSFSIAFLIGEEDA